MTSSRWLLVVGAVLVVATAWVFAPVLGHEFVDYDDHAYVVDNEHLREPLDFEWLVHNFTEIHHAYWIPLTWLSYRIDVALFGFDAPALLSVNVLLHLGSILLLWWALTRMTRQPWVSCFVALVFALHPQRVESVAWVTERKDVLSGLFWMLGMLAYVRLPRNARGDLVVAACLALGLLAKPMLVTFPVSLLLLDLWPLRRLGSAPGQRSFAALVVEKLPLFGLAGAAALIVMQTQRLMGGMDFARDFSWSLRIGHALVAYVHYLFDAFWPARLSPFYAHPMREPAPLAIMGAALLLAVITALTARQWKQRPWLAVGWAWYLVNLLPVIGLVGVGMQARADRWMYIPTIGLAMMVGSSVAEFVGARPSWRKPAIALTIAAAVAMGWTARAQVHHWRSTETLFSHAIELDSGNWYAQHRLGVLRRAESRFEEARDHYLSAVVRAPGFRYAQGELGDVFAELGRREAADALYASAERTGSGDGFADGRLGMVLVRIGEEAAAIELLEAALARDPESGDLNAALATAYARRLDIERARAHADRALRIAPRTADGLILLAWLLATAPEAELRNPEMAQRALAAFDPEDPHARADYLDALGATHAALGDFETAFHASQRALHAALTNEHYDHADAIESRSLLYLQHEPFYETRTPHP